MLLFLRWGDSGIEDISKYLQNTMCYKIAEIFNPSPPTSNERCLTFAELMTGLPSLFDLNQLGKRKLLKMNVFCFVELLYTHQDFIFLDNAPEHSSQNQINDKIDGGIEDQSEMIEAGEAEEPGRGEKGRATPGEKIHLVNRLNSIAITT